MRTAGPATTYARVVLDLSLELSPAGGRRSALEDALRSSIRSGRLSAGTSLPSTRSLGSDLGLSRSTVVSAYEQLTAEGYLVARHGSATCVAHLHTPPPSDTEADLLGPAPAHDFRPGEPDGSSFPRGRWMRSVRRVLDEAADSDIGYPDPRGVAELRATLAAYLGRTRSVVADQQAVRIVGGYGAAIGFLGDTLRRQGARRIAVEDPQLPIHVDVLRVCGLETVPIPVDRHGIDIDMLRSADVAAVVVTPAHQYPTGVTMSAERRTELVAWARERSAVIIEDDYDGEYRYDRRPIGALQGIAPDCVVYAGTASKSLTPALRLAWLVVPEPLRSELLRVTSVRSGVSAIDQRALCDFIERGELDRHVRSMRSMYRRRSTALRNTLTDVAPWLELGDSAAGLHLMALLRSDRLDEATVLAAADTASVGLLGLRTHHRSSTAGPGFSVGFSRPPEHHFPTALARLREVLASCGG